MEQGLTVNCCDGNKRAMPVKTGQSPFFCFELGVKQREQFSKDDKDGSNFNSSEVVKKLAKSFT